MKNSGWERHHQAIDQNVSCFPEKNTILINRAKSNNSLLVAIAVVSLRRRRRLGRLPAPLFVSKQQRRDLVFVVDAAGVHRVGHIHLVRSRPSVNVIKLFFSVIDDPWLVL
jgi:hypothetical protein